MFTATFVISFGIKKGNISAYSSYWYSDFKRSFQTLKFVTGQSYENKTTLKLYQFLNLYRFQFTSITSRSTTYLLFSF
jgi:hypothetical protein